ncbi:cold-shock protein [candidate division LCP-89 bacterium B3_LCP]|uniref:Cold-shock protein n=1 Tax=candidate division LCP-89 bacterium B3_LCP TaxID=2012998 RepID=A0A532UUG7_UNCL8|nr:MAG: cold-shock protein [candidate division LCP-89 bacterium B3_LCP]
MATGIVKWFSKNKGYGFVEGEGDRDIFVHFSSIKGKGYRVLDQGDEISFDLVDSPKGQQAFNVKKLKGALTEELEPA